jgi:hypothetical protein
VRRTAWGGASRDVPHCFAQIPSKQCDVPPARAYILRALRSPAAWCVAAMAATPPRGITFLQFRVCRVVGLQ